MAYISVFMLVGLFGGGGMGVLEDSAVHKHNSLPCTVLTLSVIIERSI